MSGSGLKPTTRPNPARPDPKKPGPGGGLWRAQGSGSSYGKPEPCFIDDAKSPAKSPSLTRPRPDPEEGFGRLRARAHTLSKPDTPKPGPSPKNPARPDPDITSYCIFCHVSLSGLSQTQLGGDYFGQCIREQSITASTEGQFLQKFVGMPF
ncbi:hypothetical protein ARMGADRAFT_1034766 [Armillaria gallica]|uniref:Uncharacterized protein n=1 Tax=Armillaria gallica TaxID=47427 RepID=A0A2H3DJD9_ARMGA|nr:hypothetical protein ARMGADRAFT_1034766 [Armillaria gallica]